MTHEEFTAAIHAINEYAAMIENLQNESEYLRHEVKEYMTVHGIVEAEIDGFRVRNTPVTAKRFDYAAFKEQHADIYKQFMKSTEITRLSIAPSR